MDLTNRNNWTLRYHFFDFVGNTVTKEKKKENKTKQKKEKMCGDRPYGESRSSTHLHSNA